jgi:large subunit ribosomal protein L4e
VSSSSQIIRLKKVEYHMSKTVSVYDTDGKSVGKVQLPRFFETPVRSDLVRRAVVALQSHMFQPQGRDPMAGKRTTAESIGVGHAMSRIPRVKGDRYPRANQAAFAPGTVKGRLNFPPVPTKRVAKKMNRKELKLAMLSAVAATSLKELIKARGHRIPDDRDYPLVVSDDVERIKKNSDAEKVLRNLGVWDDVHRASVRRNRAGKGSVRGRPLKHGVSALVVVERKQGAEKAFNNFSGVRVVDVRSLNVSDLAPGTQPGRLTIWTQSALRELDGRLGGSSS